MIVFLSIYTQLVILNNNFLKIKMGKEKEIEKIREDVNDWNINDIETLICELEGFVECLKEEN